eukprot:2921617-Amphidinium_carterae.2
MDDPLSSNRAELKAIYTHASSGRAVPGQYQHSTDPTREGLLTATSGQRTSCNTRKLRPKGNKEERILCAPGQVQSHLPMVTKPVIDAQIFNIQGDPHLIQRWWRPQ